MLAQDYRMGEDGRLTACVQGEMVKILLRLMFWVSTMPQPLYLNEPGNGIVV